MRTEIIRCDLCETDGREARTAVAMYRDVEGEEWDVCHEHLELAKEVDLEYQMFALARAGGGDGIKLPEQIYLQCYNTDGELLDLVHDDVTWCVDQINENDAVYVLARGKPELEEETG